MRLPLKISALLLVSLFLLSGCAQKSGGDSGSAYQSVQSVTEPDDAVGSETEEAVVWPQNKMGDLPEPSGTVLSVTDDENGVRVAVEGMGGGDAEDYVQKLKDLGYSPLAEGSGEDGGIIFSAGRDNVTVVFMFDPSGGSSPDKSLCQITLEKKA